MNDSKTVKAAPARTPRHFRVGTRVVHSEFGVGVVCEREGGVRFVRFDSGAMGTPYTRVREGK